MRAESPWHLFSLDDTNKHFMQNMNRAFGAWENLVVTIPGALPEWRVDKDSVFMR